MVKLFHSSVYSPNDAFFEKYARLKNQKETKKTHLFEGRHENIYIQREIFPEIDAVLTEAQQFAQGILGLKQLPDVGFWFNEMHQGHRTTAHRHDEDDELLSGVFYLAVPDKSGDLLLGQGDDTQRVKPQVGMFVFFAPNVVHEVEENQSTKMRLSIGMNFGLR